MLRSMMQVYVKGSVEAVQLYDQAFGAQLICEHRNEDGSFLHAELCVYGQIVAVSESRDAEITTGNTMQFCLHFGEDNKHLVEKAYEVLKQDATITAPLGPCFFSPCMVGLIDRFGVNWCLFA